MVFIVNNLKQLNELKMVDTAFVVDIINSAITI